jgi:hypothetical protein
MTITKKLLILSALISAIGVVIHVAAIFGGASWFYFFRAPPTVVASAQAGTWLAPTGALLIAVAMALCCAYALSAAQLIRRLPLLRWVLASMATVCILRVVVLIPVSIYRPVLIDTFEIIASTCWFLAGLGFLVGWRSSAEFN